MTSEADFIGAIAARPDDELLLQVFADWLEENGEGQRADWVRSPPIRRWMGEKFENPIPAIIRVLKSKKGAVEVRRAVSLIGAAIVPELLPLLKDEDAYVRLQAAWCVRKVGKVAAGTPAVALLLDLLKDPNAQVRDLATKALAEIGPAAGSDTANLRELVSDGNNFLRHDAAGILRKMGAGDAVAANLIARLEDNDPDAREDAIEGLKNLKSRAAIGPLCRALADPDPRVRASAAAALSELASLASTEVVGPLRAALADPEASVRQRATWALRGLRRGAAAAVDDLLALLRDDPEVRGNAASALADIAPGDERVLAALVQALGDERLETACSAANALERWAQLPAEVADPLLALAGRLEAGGSCPVLPALGLLERPSPGVLGLLRRVVGRVRGPGTDFASARTAADVLARFGQAGAVAIPELTRAVRAGHDNSARVLGRLGGAGVEALLGLLNAPEQRARETAAYGLGAAGEEAVAVLPRLRQQARAGGDEGGRRAAIAALGAIGWPAREAIPDLLAVMAEESSVADDAREALESCRAGLADHLPAIELLLAAAPELSSSAVPVRATRLLAAVARWVPGAAGVLRAALRIGGKGGTDSVAQVRRYAAEGLAQAREQDMLPDILPLLRDEDQEVRRAAAAALGDIGSREAAPHLVRAMSDPAAGVRARAAEALGKLKTDDLTAVGALAAAEKDEDRSVRAAARAALKKLMGKRKG
jgi:uncharacterized protein (TIGR02996 family)